KRRLHDIADARIEIEDAVSNGENDQTVAALPRRGEHRWRWPAVVSFATCIAAVAILVWHWNAQRSAPPEIRVEVSTPSTGDPFSFAISPDGRWLVFSASNEGKPQLWVRPLDSVVARPLTGTDRGIYPFWSPDSASVGFFADGKLKRIDI